MNKMYPDFNSLKEYMQHTQIECIKFNYSLDKKV